MSVQACVEGEDRSQCGYTVDEALGGIMGVRGVSWLMVQKAGVGEGMLLYGVHTVAVRARCFPKVNWRT